MIKIKLGGYVDETGKIMNKQELDEHIVMLQENLAIAIEALEFYADAKRIQSSDPHCSVSEGWSYSGYDKRPIEIGTKARDALVKISANNIATKYHNTLKNLKD